MGEYFTSGLFCLQSKHLTCECFLTMFFYREGLLAPRPTPKLEDHPLSAVRDCLFNIFAATLHIGGRSSIRNPRTRHAVVTGTHYKTYNKICDDYFQQKSLCHPFYFLLIFLQNCFFNYYSLETFLLCLFVSNIILLYFVRALHICLQLPFYLMFLQCLFLLFH